jgi:hypothetical protein
MEHVMDEHDFDAEPSTPGAVEVTTGDRARYRRAARMTGTKRANIRRRPIMVAVAAAAILAIGVATSRGVAAGPEGAASPHATDYLPSISDLMIATIQPRHERLWRAEQDENWKFATYELGNLRGAFSRLGQAHPVEHDISFPEMIASVTEQPFKELDSAIRSKDHAAFAKAYADLTEACNSCHQALNHGVVEIRAPTRASASDLNTGNTPRN